MDDAQKIEEAKKIFENLNEIFKENGLSVYVPMIFVDKQLVFIPMNNDSMTAKLDV